MERMKEYIGKTNMSLIDWTSRRNIRKLHVRPTLGCADAVSADGSSEQDCWTVRDVFCKKRRFILGGQMSFANTAPQQSGCANYIGGNWRRSNSGEESEKRNPANLRDMLGITIASSRLETKEAIAAATRALPAWSDTPAPTRGEFLLR